MVSSGVKGWGAGGAPALFFQTPRALQEREEVIGFLKTDDARDFLAMGIEEDDPGRSEQVEAFEQRARSSGLFAVTSTLISSVLASSAWTRASLNVNRSISRQETHQSAEKSSMTGRPSASLLSSSATLPTLW